MRQGEIIGENNGIFELLTTSQDPVCRSYLRFIERAGKMQDVKHCIEEALNTRPDVYESTEEFLKMNPDYEEQIDAKLNYDEESAIKSYSGYRFAWINSVARGIWDYEKLGQKTPELEAEIKDSTQKIITAISKAPTAARDFTTFRGVSLSGFKAYGVNELADLENMKGQFMLEQGFSSTAIVRERNFAEQEVQSLWISAPNIEMRMHIPAGADNFIALTSDKLSYSPQQTEVLIDHNALSYINDVTFGKDGHAIVDAILIPRSVYE